MFSFLLDEMYNFGGQITLVNLLHPTMFTTVSCPTDSIVFIYEFKIMLELVKLIIKEGLY